MNNERHFFDVDVKWCREAQNPYCKFDVPAIEFAVGDWKQFLDRACECGALSIVELRAYIDEKEAEAGSNPALAPRG